MMLFFNRNWVGVCWGRWVGPGLMWIGLKALDRRAESAGSGRGTPLQKQERMGVGKGFARGRSDA